MLLLTLALLADSGPSRVVAVAPAETVAVHLSGAGRPVARGHVTDLST